jgi:hypothetical protein
MSQSVRSEEPDRPEIKIVREVSFRLLAALMTPIFFAVAGTGLTVWREFHLQTELLRQMREDMRVYMERVNAEKARNDVQDAQLQQLIKQGDISNARLQSLERTGR